MDAPGTLDLPKGWEAIWSKSKGKFYYYKKATGQKLWTVPTSENVNSEMRMTNSTGRSYLYNTRSGLKRWNKKTNISTLNPLPSIYQDEPLNERRSVSVAPGTSVVVNPLHAAVSDENAGAAAPPLGTEIASNPTNLYKNNKGQLSQNNMHKIEELVKWNDSIFRRIQAAIQRKICPTKVTCEFNLANYTVKLLGDDSKPTEPEIRDILRQLIALEQILDGTRVITKKSIPIFQNSLGSSLLMTAGATAMWCGVGLITGVLTGFAEGAALGQIVSDMGAKTAEYQEWLLANPEPTIENIKTEYPNASDDALKLQLSVKNKSWYKSSMSAKFYFGVSTPSGRDLLHGATLGTGIGLVAIGTGALAGFLGTPIVAGLVTPVVKGVRLVCKKMNRGMILDELRFILNMARMVPVYRKIYDEIETELNTTLTVNPVATMKMNNFLKGGYSRKHKMRNRKTNKKRN
jgi:hypothetical protein